MLRSQHRVYDGRGEVARTQDVWGAEGISSRVKFLPLAWAGMPKTSFRKNSDSPKELDRARNKLEWLITFKSYVTGMESFDDIKYHQDDLKATKSYVNSQIAVAKNIKNSALNNILKHLKSDILKRLN